MVLATIVGNAQHSTVFYNMAVAQGTSLSPLIAVAYRHEHMWRGSRRAIGEDSSNVREKVRCEGEREAG